MIHVITKHIFIGGWVGVKGVKGHGKAFFQQYLTGKGVTSITFSKPFPKQSLVFTAQRMEAFENIVGKGENGLVTSIFYFFHNVFGRLLAQGKAPSVLKPIKILTKHFFNEMPSSYNICLVSFICR